MNGKVDTGENISEQYIYFLHFALFHLMPINNQQVCCKSINNWSKNIFEIRLRIKREKNTKTILLNKNIEMP